MQYVIALCLLPYLKVTPLSSDTQPHAMLALIVAMSGYSIKTGRLKLYPVTIFISVLFLVAGIAFDEIVLGISLAMLPVGIDFISRQDEEKIIQGAKIALMILLFGLVVNVLAESVLVHLVSNFRTGGSRGFNSFASEASFLGLLGVACALIFHVLNAGWKWFGISGLIVFLSGSATAIFPFILFLILIYVRGWKILLLPMVAASIFFGIQYAVELDSRFGSIVRIMVQNPELIFTDQSFSNRIIRSWGPIVAAYENGLIPQGLSADIDIGFTSLSNQATYHVDRLNSPGPVLIYGFGFLSFPIIFAYIYRSRGPIELWVMLLYFSIANISTATPYLWVLYALPWILKRRKQATERRRFSPPQQHQRA